jgi:hypothetical protein
MGHRVPCILDQRYENIEPVTILKGSAATVIIKSAQRCLLHRPRQERTGVRLFLLRESTGPTHGGEPADRRRRAAHRSEHRQAAGAIEQELKVRNRVADIGPRVPPSWATSYPRNPQFAILNKH